MAAASRSWSRPPLAGPATAAAQGLGASRVVGRPPTIYARCDPSSPPRAVLRQGRRGDDRGGQRRLGLGPRRRHRRARLPEAHRARADPGHRARRRGTPRPRDRPRPRRHRPRAARRRARPGGRCASPCSAPPACSPPPPRRASTPILDTRSGTDVGVGAQVAWQSGRLRGLFVEVDASRFEETGERAFVARRRGVPARHPADDRADADRGVGRLSAQRRCGGRAAAWSPRRIAYFAGGGVGSRRLHARRTTTGDVTDRFTAYHVMGGADVTRVAPAPGRRRGALSLGAGRPRRRRRLGRLQRDRPWRHDVPRPHRRWVLAARAGWPRRRAPLGRHAVHPPGGGGRAQHPAGPGRHLRRRRRPRRPDRAPPAPSATSCGTARTRRCPATGSIAAGGALGGYTDPQRKKQRLAAEGVTFSGRRIRRFADLRWAGEDAATPRRRRPV